MNDTLIPKIVQLRWPSSEVFADAKRNLKSIVTLLLVALFLPTIRAQTR